MKKFLVACIAAAAFYGAPAFATPPAAPVFNWTGFYVGGQIGEGWDATSPTLTVGPADFPAGFMLKTLHASGLLGGGYAGFNYQINQFVIGIEGDYSWANLVGSAGTVGVLGGTQDRTAHINWIATLAGRLGYAVNDWMLFGKAGWTWEGLHANGSVFDVAGVNTSNFVTPQQTRNGPTIGTGVEWGFARNWSDKLEYDYVKFNNKNNYTISIGAISGSVFTGVTSVSVSSLNVVKLGVAYRY
jgi:outer membrane immunogenic protein